MYARNENKANKAPNTTFTAGPIAATGGKMTISITAHTTKTVPTIPAPKAVHRAVLLTSGRKMITETLTAHTTN